MKRNIFLMGAMLCAATFLISCTNDEITDAAPAAVKFTSTVATPADGAPITKAAGTAWAGGDAIGIYMVKTTTFDISENTANRKYTTTGGSAFGPATAADAIYYPVDGSAVDFIAYYPHDPAVANFTYPVNVGVQTSQPNIDLLWSNNATGKSKATAGNVTLTFDHKLVKLILNTLPGAGLTQADLDGMSVSIKGMNTKNTFDLKTGALGTAGTPADITPYAPTAGKKYEAIVLPVTTAATGDVSVEFTVGTDVFVWKVPAATKLEAGKEYTYDITITRTGVTVTGTINDWTQVPGPPGLIAE